MIQFEYHYSLLLSILLLFCLCTSVSIGFSRYDNSSLNLFRIQSNHYYIKSWAQKSPFISHPISSRITPGSHFKLSSFNNLLVYNLALLILKRIYHFQRCSLVGSQSILYDKPSKIFNIKGHQKS